MNDRCKSNTAQPSLFTAVRWPKAAAPKRAEVLRLIEDMVRWEHIEEMVRPYYRADVQRTGRRGYSLKMMLRCFALQVFWCASDRQLESAVLDSHSLSRFIGTDPWQPRPPSASAIRGFRTLLERARPSGYLETLAELVELEMLNAVHTAGLEFRPGEIREPIFRKIRSCA